jgi:O-antigen biosynthesis rhamnosyltransferase
MKVLHVYKSYYPFSTGGVEKHIHSLLDSLAGMGVETALITTKPDQPFTQQIENQTQVYYFPANLDLASCPVSFSLLKNFSKIAQNFDILHYHFPWPFADLTQLFSPRKPVVVTYHSDIVRQKWLNKLYIPIRQLFLKRADAIIASSDNYLNSSPVLNEYRQKVTVIPFGLEASQYPQPTVEEMTNWRERVGQDFFLFVGVLRYYKGLDFLLEAVRNTNIQVVIAGAGPEESRLKQIKADHKMDNVIFTGYISDKDKAALYHLCRASVAPSHLRTEAFCFSLLESLIYGKPAISTELNTGTSFVNQHHVSGLVVPPANPEKLRAAMQLLLTDQGLYQRLQQNTHTHYARHFTSTAMRDTHLELYRRILLR